jgi:hypothetical protein
MRCIEHPGRRLSKERYALRTRWRPSSLSCRAICRCSVVWRAMASRFGHAPTIESALHAAPYGPACAINRQHTRTHE